MKALPMPVGQPGRQNVQRIGYLRVVLNPLRDAALELLHAAAVGRVVAAPESAEPAVAAPVTAVVGVVAEATEAAVVVVGVVAIAVAVLRVVAVAVVVVVARRRDGRLSGGSGTRGLKVGRGGLDWKKVSSLKTKYRKYTYCLRAARRQRRSGRSRHRRYQR